MIWMHLLFLSNCHLQCFCFPHGLFKAVGILYIRSQLYELLIILCLFLSLLKEIERRVGQSGKAACTCEEAVGRWDTAEGGPTEQTPEHKGRPAVQNADVRTGNKWRWLKNWEF